MRPPLTIDALLSTHFPAFWDSSTTAAASTAVRTLPSGEHRDGGNKTPQQHIRTGLTSPCEEPALRRNAALRHTWYSVKMWSLSMVWRVLGTVCTAEGVAERHTTRP